MKIVFKTDSYICKNDKIINVWTSKIDDKPYKIVLNEDKSYVLELNEEIIEKGSYSTYNDEISFKKDDGFIWGCTIDNNIMNCENYVDTFIASN